MTSSPQAVTERFPPPRWRAAAVSDALLRSISRPAGPDAPQFTAEFLHRYAQSYAGLGRAVIGVLLAIIAPFSGPPIGVAACTVVAVCFAGWSVLHGRWMRRRPSTWVWGSDVAVLCALALAQPLLVDPAATVQLSGWITPLVSFAAVALQWHTSVRTGLAMAALLGLALVVGAALTPGVGLAGALTAGGVWTVVEGGLSRLLWRLVQRAGRIADAVMERAFTEQRAAATAAARRADQRLHWSTVHDTAASTLLMVGLGEVHGDEPWLADQVRRDVAALRDEQPDPAARRELVQVLTEVAGRAHVEVDLELPADLPDGVPVPGPVATAVEGAVGEALENVRRHAGTGRAALVLAVGRDTAPDSLPDSPPDSRPDSGPDPGPDPESGGAEPGSAAGDVGRIVVVVRDAGVGFDPAGVPGSRHGLVLSVRERMARAGGRAEVRSAPGEGTEVRLEWPGG